MSTPIDRRAILPVAQMSDTPTQVALRGPSGHLYGILNLHDLTIAVKRKGGPVEVIDLKPVLALRPPPE